MLPNAYFLAKFRFDTAENEPAKNLQNFAKISKNSQKSVLTPSETKLSPQLTSARRLRARLVLFLEPRENHINGGARVFRAPSCEHRSSRSCSITSTRGLARFALPAANIVRRVRALTLSSSRSFVRACVLSFVHLFLSFIHLTP